MLKYFLVVAAGVCLFLAGATPAQAATIFARLFPFTGEVRLKNDSNQPVPIVFYSIESNAGALNSSPVRWLSVTDHYDAPIVPSPGNGFVDPNGAWVKLSSASTELAEGALDLDGGSLAARREVSLGRIWNSSVSDLAFAATEPNGQPISILTVSAIDGDYERDGDVDQADYSKWRQSFGSTTMLDADGNLNGVVDAADYVIWRNNLGLSLSGLASASGVGGALSSLVAGAAVPEPGSVIQVMGALAVLSTCRRCIRRRLRSNA